jgi:hypothetical protein
LAIAARGRERAALNFRPDGQISASPVQPPSQKYSGSLLRQITCISFPIPAHTEGRFAIVTNVGCGMRWTRMALLTRAHYPRTAKSCGPYVQHYFSSARKFKKPLLDRYFWKPSGQIKRPAENGQAVNWPLDRSFHRVLGFPSISFCQAAISSSNQMRRFGLM